MKAVFRPVLRPCVTVLVVALACQAAGCATLAHGREQEIRVDSVPTAALVSVDGEDWGPAPCVIRVRRHDNHTVRIAATGYEASGVTLTRELSHWAWLNALNGALPGVIVDALSGGLYDLSPASIRVTLAAQATRSPAP